MASDDQSSELCYVVYMPFSERATCCPIDVPRNAKVDALRNKIRNHAEFQRHVESEQVHLYQCGELDIVPPGSNASQVRYQKAMEWIHEHRSMEPTFLLREYFPSGPAQYEEKKIDVIAVTNSIKESHDFVCSLPDVNNSRLIKFSVERASDTKKIRSPSDVALNPKSLKDCVENADMHIHRPAFNYGPHTSLFHHALARLKHRLDHLDDDAIWTGELEPDSDLLGECQDYLIASCGVYDREETRGPLLNLFFHNMLKEEGTYGKSVAGGKAVPDGVWGNPPRAIREEKNEDGSGGNASVQGIVSYRKIIAQQSSMPYIMRSNCPVIIFGVMGTRIEISTAVYVGGVYSDKLISHEPYVDEFQSERLLRLGRMAMAVRHCYDELDDYYRSIDLDARSSARHLYPAPLPVEGSEPVPTLEYIGKLTHGGETISVVPNERDDEIAGEERRYAIYRAKLIVPNGNKVDVVVKFTARYNCTAHRLLEGAMFAPKLHYFARLVSGHYMVVMDFVENPPLSDVPKQKNYRDICQRVKEAVGILHKKNLVFGDLRPQNIVLNPDGRPLLIDFDVTGTHGVDRYPVSWDTKRHHSGVRRNGIMDKEHDTYLLGILEGTLKDRSFEPA